MEGQKKKKLNKERSDMKKKIKSSTGMFFWGIFVEAILSMRGVYVGEQ